MKLNLKLPYLSKSNLLPLLIILSFCTALLAACGGGGSGGRVGISGTLTNCKGDSVYLFQQIGYFPQKVSSAKISSKDGSFELRTNPEGTSLYYIGINPQLKSPILLGDENAVSFSADCGNFYRTARVENSALNTSYNLAEGTLQNLTKQINQMNQNLQIFGSANPQMVPQIQAQLNNFNQKKEGYIDSLSMLDGFFGDLGRLHSFKTFGTDPTHSKYVNELQYYAHEYLKGIDFSSPTVISNPQATKRLNTFAQIMGQNGIPLDTFMAAVNPIIHKAAGSKATQQTIYLALLEGLDQSKSNMYVGLGKQYLSAYNDNSPISAQIVTKIDVISKFAKGATPPELDFPTPAGPNMKLSSLKGKVVLVDFWASWCKPCRRANPHVVSLYNKYKSKGFDVLGVSLDKKKAPWLAAIKKDGLMWNHISDLGGWQSQAAKLYGVSSIPATFLLDREGKIIAKDLREPGLDNKLKEIFGF